VVTSVMSMPPGASRMSLPFAVTSVTTCRHAITEACEERGVDRMAVEEVNLVVGELVMNAVRHGRPLPGDTVETAWAFLGDSTLRFSVRDGGHVDELHAQIPSPTALGGRGLGIVERLCSAWSYSTSDGTEVVADIAIRSASSARH
jgi:serine/threonine-protein kinase RsbW